MMPPPGCVADPHMYRFLIGVRNCAQPGTGRKKKSCSRESSPWKILPSLSPNSRSRSSGVSTCLFRIMLFKFGAYSEIVSITVLPNASRWSSQFNPGRSLYGAYCTKHDITCFPGGATDGSVSDGITMSIYGRREKLPYFASSYARSMYSTLGEIEIAPRKCAPGPGRHLKSGSASNAMLTFPDDPRNLYRRTSSRNSPGNRFSSMNLMKVNRGSTLEEITSP